MSSIGSEDYFYLNEYCIGSNDECNVIVTGTSFVDLDELNFEVFPNPSAGAITIRCGKRLFSRAQILDMTGGEMQTILIESNTQENTLHLELGMLPQGMYLFLLWQDGKIIFQDKIVLID